MGKWISSDRITKGNLKPRTDTEDCVSALVLYKRVPRGLLPGERLWPAPRG